MFYKKKKTTRFIKTTFLYKNSSFKKNLKHTVSLFMVYKNL